MNEALAISLLLLACALLTVGIVVLIVQDARDEEPFITDVSSVAIVIFDRGRQRASLQLEYLQKFVDPSWCDRIVVMRHDGLLPLTNIPNEPIPVVVIDDVPPSTTLEQAFINVSALSHGAVADTDAAMVFLGDYTIPIKRITLDYIFSLSKKKYAIVNYISPEELTLQLQNVVEDTMPATITLTHQLASFGSALNYMLSVSTGNSYVFAVSLNQVIILIDNSTTESANLGVEPIKNEVWQTILLSTVGNQTTMNNALITHWQSQLQTIDQ